MCPWPGHVVPSDLSITGMNAGGCHSDVSPLCPAHSVPGLQSVDVKSQASQQLQEEARFDGVLFRRVRK